MTRSLVLQRLQFSAQCPCQFVGLAACAKHFAGIAEGDLSDAGVIASEFHKLAWMPRWNTTIEGT